MAKKIEMEVHGGMCRLEFQPGMSTGPTGSDSSPGVGFNLTSEVPAFGPHGGLYHHGTGVIGRSDARKLRDALDEFFRQNP